MNISIKLPIFRNIRA